VKHFERNFLKQILFFARASIRKLKIITEDVLLFCKLQNNQRQIQKLSSDFINIKTHKVPRETFNRI
jgi:hypothetical protein